MGTTSICEKCTREFFSDSNDIKNQRKKQSHRSNSVSNSIKQCYCIGFESSENSENKSLKKHSVWKVDTKFGKIKEIKIENCKIHRQLLANYICIHPICQKMGMLVCMDCLNESHSKCNIQLIFEIKQFNDISWFNSGEALSRIHDLTKLASKWNLEIRYLQEFRDFLEKEIKKFENLDACFNSTKISKYSFTQNLENKTIIAQNKNLLEIENILFEIIDFFSENFCLFDLNSLLKKFSIENWTNKLIAFRIEPIQIVNNKQKKCTNYNHSLINGKPKTKIAIENSENVICDLADKIKKTMKDFYKKKNQRFKKSKWNSKNKIEKRN